MIALTSAISSVSGVIGSAIGVIGSVSVTLGNIPFLVNLFNWCNALLIVASPFLKTVAIWFGWQMSIGLLAWSTARFYGINCTPPGLSGFVTSLFAMGNPICVSAWFSHASFVVAYIASFVAAMLIAMIWIWKRTSAYPMIKKLRNEIQILKDDKSPTIKQLREQIRKLQSEKTRNNWNEFGHDHDE